MSASSSVIPFKVGQLLRSSTLNSFFGIPVANVLGYGATGNGVTDDAPAIQKAADSLIGTGGSLIFPPGLYLFGGAVTLHSGTQASGTLGTSVIASPTLRPITSANPLLPPVVYTFFANTNWQASDKTDHDITIEGINFELGLGPDNLQPTGVFMRQASRIRVKNNIYTGNGTGNLTKFMATAYTWIEDNTVINAGTPFGTFEGPTDGWITNNWASSQLYCVLITGSDFTQHGAVSVKTADRFHVAGNTFTGIGGGTLIMWIQGLGAPGSAASHVDISNNIIYPGSSGFGAIKISGSGVDVQILDNQFIGGSGTSGVIYSTTEAFSGCIPAQTRIAGNTFDGFDATGHPLIGIAGANDVVENNHVTNCSYSYGVSMTGGGTFTGSMSGTTLTVISGLAGNNVIGRGMVISGSGVSTTTVLQGLTGTGGNGSTFLIDVSQTVASTAMTANGNQYASLNVMPTGTSGYYFLGGNGYTLVEPGKPIAWTPQLRFGGTPIESQGGAYASQVGFYYLNGKQVRITCSINLTAKGTATGNATIAVLPIVDNGAVSPHGTAMTISAASLSASLVPIVLTSTASQQFLLFTAVSGGSNVTDTNFINTALLSFSGTYEIA